MSATDPDVDLKQGATETIRQQFVDDDGNAIDVSSYDELKFFLRTDPPPDGNLLVNADASFDSVEGDGTGTDGWVKYDLSTSETNTDGVHVAEFYYEGPGGSPVKRSPDRSDDEYIIVEIIKRLGAIGSTTIDAGDFTSDVDASGFDILNLGILNFNDVTNSSPSEGDMWREGGQFYVEPDGNGQEVFPASGGGGSGGSAVIVQNNSTSLTSDATVIDFQDGLDATEPVADEIDVVLDASVISPSDLGFDPATQAELNSQTHPLGDLEQSGASDGEAAVWDSGTSSWQPVSVGGGSINIYDESGPVAISPDLVRFKDDSDVLTVDVTNPASGEAAVTYRVTDGTIDPVHLSFDPATQTELNTHIADVDAHRTDANIRSVVEGVTDVADLVGSLGTADQVPLTDGSAVSWGDVDLATLADALDKNALDGAQGADGQVWTSTGSGAQWEDAPSGGGGGGDVTSDTATASGDGSTTSFTLSHSLGSTPDAVSVQPTSADASADFYQTIKTSTDITIQYNAAPPSGSGNLSYDITTVGSSSSSVAADTATASGNGSTVTFSLNHSLGATPTSVQVQPASTDASANFFVSGKGSSTVEITYNAAPVSGSGNLTYEIITST